MKINQFKAWVNTHFNVYNESTELIDNSIIYRYTYLNGLNASITLTELSGTSTLRGGLFPKEDNREEINYVMSNLGLTHYLNKDSFFRFSFELNESIDKDLLLRLHFLMGFKRNVNNVLLYKNI